jgi:hypothetical protein
MWANKLDEPSGHNGLSVQSEKSVAKAVDDNEGKGYDDDVKRLC